MYYWSMIHSKFLPDIFLLLEVYSFYIIFSVTLSPRSGSRLLRGDSNLCTDGS